MKSATSINCLNSNFKDSDAYADYYDYEDSEYTVNPITADLSGRPTKPTTSKPVSTLFPSIAGLNLSSITTSGESSTTTSAPETVVVIHEKPSMPPAAAQETDKIMETSSVSYQPDQIPVQVIVEPVLKPKTKPSTLPPVKRKLTNRQVSVKNDDDFEVRPRRRRGQLIERMRLRRAQNRRNGCENGQVSDGQNGCRVRRSGMGGFLGMLARFLPMRDTE